MPENTISYFFEGVEKLLELWFDDSVDPEADLRKIPRSTWENLLKIVKCEIIGFMKNEVIDAYVLSESSLFVSKRRIILKTCGTTTPLKCLKEILEVAKEFGYTEICDLFYSRKNFSRPEMQIFPHRGYFEEVEILDAMFENGRSYCLGSINRECWFLYTFSKNVNTPNSPNTNSQQSAAYSEPDQTIEILMQHLDPNVMSKFEKSTSATAEEATVSSGINKILPHMIIDDALFDPCGYSMNGIGQNGDYMTIHITPEKQFSYVSFESNVSLGNYTSLINRVIKTFKPKKFIITIFANKASAAYTTIKELEIEYTEASNWHRNDMQCCNFPSYNLLYAQYVQS